MARNLNHRRVALFAAVVLALQSLLTAEVLAAIAVDSGTFSVVTICTGNGFKRITLDTENNPVAPRDGRDIDCPTCTLAYCSALALPAESGTAYRPPANTIAAEIPATSPLDSQGPDAPNSRAPPAHTRHTKT